MTPVSDQSLLKVRIIVDPISRAWIREIARCMSLLGELVPRPVEFIQLVDNLPDRAAAFDLKSLPAGGTSDRRIVLEPCQALRDLVSAMRAREGLGEFIADLTTDTTGGVSS